MLPCLWLRLGLVGVVAAPADASGHGHAEAVVAVGVAEVRGLPVAVEGAVLQRQWAGLVCGQVVQVGDVGVCQAETSTNRAPVGKVMRWPSLCLSTLMRATSSASSEMSQASTSTSG